MLRIKAARFLLYLTALTPLLFAGSFYFPYVVPRTILFRVLVEAAALIFIWLWCQGRIRLSTSRRWYHNYFILALGLIIAVDFTAAVFGLSFNNSLFGDIERSWGVYTVAHLCLFYVLLRVFFDNQAWKTYLNCLLASTLVVAIYGVVQYYPNIFHITLFQSGPGRILSTLGNPAYTAMTLMFGMVLAVYLLLKSSLKWHKYLYGALIIVHFFAFTLTGIRGAYLGFLAGLAMALILALFVSRERLVRRASLALLLLLFIISGLFFSFRGNHVVQNLPIVGRLTSINLADSTVKTRLISWQAALEGFKDNPILGVGLENYGAVFNKYFDPIYYSLASSEPYFDRAHNSFLDILAATGLMGALAWLTLIVCLYYYLWQGYKSGRLTRGELILFNSLAAAYFVHIFFVFDDINSLLLFFVFLGLIEFTYHKNPLFDSTTAATKFSSIRLLAALIMGLIIVWYGLVFNMRIANASLSVIDGLLAQDNKEAVQYFRGALAVKSIPRLGLADSYVDWLVKIANDYKKVPTPESKRLFDDNFNFIKTALEEELNKNKYNPIIFLKLSTLYCSHFLVYGDSADKDFAVAYVGGAIALSPERPQYYNLLAETYVIFGDGKKAAAAAEKSLSLNPDYVETYVYLVRSYAADSQLDKSFSYFQESLKRGISANTEDAALELGGKFIKENQVAKAAEIYRLLSIAKPESTKALINLSIVSLRLNKPDDAIKYAEQAAARDSGLKTDVDYIVGQIRAGNIKQLLEKLGV